MEHPKHIQIWAQMQKAQEEGDLETYFRLQDEQRAVLTGKSSRSDEAPAEPAPAADDGIDWEKVAREAKTMVDLNAEATRRWQESQGASEAEE